MHNTHTGNTHTAKRWLTGLLMSGCLLASQVGAAPSGKDMTIWFDLGGPVGESYVTVVQNGAKQAAEDLGVDLRLVYSDWQPQKMIENFKQAVAAGEQADQQLFDHLILANDHACDGCAQIRQLDDLLLYRLFRHWFIHRRVPL